MLGRNPGWVTTQGEVLADLFAQNGYPVRLTSTIPQRIPRMADILYSLWKWRSQIDLVILSVFSGPGFVAADLASRFARRLGKPVVAFLHGGGLPDFAGRRPGYVRAMLDRSSLVASPSNFLAHYFRGWGYPVEVIPNVLAIQDYPYRHRPQVRPCLLWMRTFHPLYHPEMAIEVLEQVSRRYPQATLTMAGQEKGLLSAVKELAVRRGVAERVRFAGFLDLSAKQAEFSAHDIYLHTNRADNMPVSVLEAGAFGLPVIATRVGGIPYLLTDEQDALIVEDSDVPGMAAAVSRLIEDPALAARLSAGGRKLAEASAWEAVHQQWQEVFRRLQSHVDR
jgi:glycosyltransferase involved in cell wall biosynthesis